MLGDIISGLSSGMYGTPIGIGLGIAGIGLKAIGAGMSMSGAREEYEANEKQLLANIKALEEEKAYNIENYQQRIADQVASNKFSFYSSGLDINTGTAYDVIKSNKAAATADMDMMIKQYDTELKSLKEKRKANETNLMSNMANTIIGSIL